MSMTVMLQCVISDILFESKSPSQLTLNSTLSCNNPQTIHSNIDTKRKASVGHLLDRHSPVFPTALTLRP